jgi:hypothetical protein
MLHPIPFTTHGASPITAGEPISNIVTEIVNKNYFYCGYD